MRSAFATLLAVLTLAGCSAITAVTDASEPLDAFTLTPVRPAVFQSGGRHLVVPVAAASGALATDRILVKPNRLQAEYLPSARWIDPAPVLIQSLLVASLQTSEGFRLVGRDDAGLDPDFVLLVDLTDFQAEAPSEPGSAWLVRVGLSATIVREEDRSIVASRRFESTGPALSDETLAIVNGFDAAVSQVLHETVAWTVRQTR